MQLELNRLLKTNFHFSEFIISIMLQSSLISSWNRIMNYNCQIIPWQSKSNNLAHFYTDFLAWSCSDPSELHDILLQNLMYMLFIKSIFFVSLIPSFHPFISVNWHIMDHDPQKVQIGAFRRSWTMVHVSKSVCDGFIQKRSKSNKSAKFQLVSAQAWILL